MIKRTIVTFLAYVGFSKIFCLSLEFWGMPTSPINWSVSIALLSLFIPTFYFSHDNSRRVKALAWCAIVSVLGYCWFLMGEGFNQLYYSMTWLGAAGFCFYFRQRVIGCLALTLGAFGALMVWRVGGTIPAEYEGWVVARNTIYVALLSVATAQSWMENAPAETETSSEQRDECRQKAA